MNFLSLYFYVQTDTVQALRGDPDSSEAEHARIMLVQTEVERVKFVVRSYIRTRLYKATKFLYSLPSSSFFIRVFYRSKNSHGTS
jgi:GINS complex subunit 4